MVPAIVNYMAALEGAVVAGTEGGDTQAALTEFDARRSELNQRLTATDVVSDVRLATNTLLNYGQDLVDQVMSNSIDLRRRVTTYAPFLLTSETAITGSARGDQPQNVELQAEGLSRAVGARGQMAMQQMLVNRGADLPEPELRTSMITLAGTEPSTIAGMGKVLGGATPRKRRRCASEMVQRMSIISDPASVWGPATRSYCDRSRQPGGVANEMIADTTSAIPAAVGEEATAQRNTAIRDAALVLAAILLALLLVTLVARSLVRPLRPCATVR